MAQIMLYFQDLISNRNGLNYVQSSMFDSSKPKIGCLSSITNRWTRSRLCNVQKDDVRVNLKSNLENLVKALLGSMFVRSKPKIGGSSLIANRWKRWSSFNVRKLMFEFVRSSLNWCSTHHYKIETSLSINEFL